MLLPGGFELPPAVLQCLVGRFELLGRVRVSDVEEAQHRILEIAQELEEKEEIATWFDLSERQVNWVTSAKAGEDEDGYSEGLVGIDQEGWFPLRIRASDYEAHVIDGGAADVADLEPETSTNVTGPENRSAGARADGGDLTSMASQEDD